MKQTRIQKHYSNIVVEDLLLMYNCQNTMQLPEINKGVVSISSKNSLLDRQELLNNFLTCFLISGQRSAPTRARKSISAFQLRKGSMMGCMVTMRKNKMYALLDKIVSFVLPCLQSQPAKKRRNPRSLALHQAHAQQVALAAHVQSPSDWLCRQEQRDISFGVKEPTFFPEIESLSGAGALVQTDQALLERPTLRSQATQVSPSKIPTYKQTFGVLQGLNILFSFCTHRSPCRLPLRGTGNNRGEKERKGNISNYISRIQALQTQLAVASVKHTVVKQSDCINTQDKANHMFFLSQQKKTSQAYPFGVQAERQKDLLFISAFQYPVRASV